MKPGTRIYYIFPLYIYIIIYWQAVICQNSQSHVLYMITVYFPKLTNYKITPKNQNKSRCFPSASCISMFFHLRYNYYNCSIIIAISGYFETGEILEIYQQEILLEMLILGNFCFIFWQVVPILWRSDIFIVSILCENKNFVFVKMEHFNGNQNSEGQTIF